MLASKKIVWPSRLPLTKPDNDELNAESISGLLVVVLDDLRRKDNNPAGDRDGTQNATDSLDVEAVAH
jgi:hypothetical protein